MEPAFLQWDAEMIWRSLVLMALIQAFTVFFQPLLAQDAQELNAILTNVSGNVRIEEGVPPSAKAARMYRVVRAGSTISIKTGYVRLLCSNDFIRESTETLTLSETECSKGSLFFPGSYQLYLNLDRIASADISAGVFAPKMAVRSGDATFDLPGSMLEGRATRIAAAGGSPAVFKLPPDIRCEPVCKVQLKYFVEKLGPDIVVFSALDRASFSERPTDDVSNALLVPFGKPYIRRISVLPAADQARIDQELATLEKIPGAWKERTLLKAAVLQRNGLLQEALAAIPSFGRDDRANIVVGKLYLQLGLPSAALGAFRKVHAAEFRFQALCTGAATAETMGDHAEAQTWWRELIKFRETSGQSYLSCSQFYIDTFSTAVDHILRASPGGGFN